MHPQNLYVSLKNVRDKYLFLFSAVLPRKTYVKHMYPRDTERTTELTNTPT